MAKMSSSRVVCSVGRTTSWLLRLTSSPSRSASTSGPRTPAAQTTSSEGMKSPLASRTPSALTSVTRAFTRTSMPRPCSRRKVVVGEPRRQAGQDAVRGLDQGDLDVLVRVDPVEPVGHHRARRAVQLGRELGAGGARADDRDVQLPGPDRLDLGVRAQAGVDQPAVEAGRLVGRFQRDRVLLGTRACRSRCCGSRRRSPACRRRTARSGVIGRPSSSWVAASRTCLLARSRPIISPKR